MQKITILELISDDNPGRIIIYKRIDKSRNKVIIKSPEKFESGCSKIFLSPVGDKCRISSVRIGYMIEDKYYII